MACPDNIRFQCPEVLYATTTSDVVVVLQYVTPYIRTGACMYSITLHPNRKYCHVFTSVSGCKFTRDADHLKDRIEVARSDRNKKVGNRVKFDHYHRLCLNHISLNSTLAPSIKFLNLSKLCSCDQPVAQNTIDGNDQILFCYLLSCSYPISAPRCGYRP